MQASPHVTSCSAAGCAWNRDMECHTPAIVVVGAMHAQCDTFTTEPHRPTNEIASVSVCHEHDCTYNTEMSCSAPEVAVTAHRGHADCATYHA